VKGLMVMVSAIIVFTTVVLFLWESLSGDDIYGLAIGWGILAFILFLFWNYRGLQIQIDNSKLFVKYGLFNHKTFLLGEMASCESIRASFGRYLGVGIRYGFDGSLAYTTSFGEAVKIVLKKGRPFVFSSHKPEEICQILRGTSSSSQKNA